MRRAGAGQGDVVVHRDEDGKVVHSATVTEVGEETGEVTKVKGLGGVETEPKETTPKDGWPDPDAEIEYWRKRPKPKKDEDDDEGDGMPDNSPANGRPKNRPASNASKPSSTLAAATPPNPSANASAHTCPGW